MYHLYLHASVKFYWETHEKYPTKCPAMELSAMVYLNFDLSPLSPWQLPFEAIPH